LAHRINLDHISPVTAEFVIFRNGKLGFGSAKMREAIPEFVVQNPTAFAAGTDGFQSCAETGKVLPRKALELPTSRLPEPAANASRQHMITVVKETYARFDRSSSTSAHIAA